ncbi:hypothetical protein [Variovorax sp. LG9.2]|uniref:hypothetical protein n=1 Tax=Variovorax sp. LG9.2 TaxID=3048626 RepID=UPI002B229C03|nr:hypothetical protein [Variovorax sp. LG9.2]MEB0059538.1 hypothetical protein [Variovorax sp. LG9.2]
MNNVKRLLLSGWFAAAVLVSACGGGGGGGGGGFAFLPVASTPETPAAPPAPAPVTAAVMVNGLVTFDSVPNTTGSLAYAATIQKPVRGATVQLVSTTQAVLATTTTDASGNYAASVAQGSTFFVRVRAALLNTGASSWDVTVRDNTQGEGVYALESGLVVAAGAAMQKDVNAPSGWSGTSYGTLRAAAPFAILDTIYMTQQKVLSVAPSTAFPPLKVLWSVNNLPASGNPALGQIGTTFFTASTTGAAIYVLGKADVDTDEYDASVIAHEWGHYYQSVFSRDDSPGGEHGSNDLLDRRVAFSEGWGNAWSGIALNRANYTDSAGPGQSIGLNANLAVGAVVAKGWFNEDSIQYVLWTLNQVAGFKPIHAAMTGPLKASAAVTSIHSFNAALKTASNSASASIASLLTSESIDPNSDAWGSTESNSGGSAVALPMYRTLTSGAALPNVCVSNALGSEVGDNKLGNYAYVRLSVLVAKAYQISVAGGGPATDPDFRVYNASGVVAKAEAVAPGSESASVALTPGEYVLAVTDYQNKASSTCFTVSAN